MQNRSHDLTKFTDQYSSFYDKKYWNRHFTWARAEPRFLENLFWLVLFFSWFTFTKQFLTGYEIKTLTWFSKKKYCSRLMASPKTAWKMPESPLLKHVLRATRQHIPKLLISPAELDKTLLSKTMSWKTIKTR